MAFNKINEFDFDTRKCKPGNKRLYEPTNGLEENKNIMINALQFFCMNCRLCSIGCKLFGYDGEEHDPHVFSNMKYKSKFVVVGQNPGRDECKFGTPFIGAAGKNFDEEIEKNGLNRNDFYISNVVKCATRTSDGSGNRKPSNKEKETCSSIFLATELKILKPKLIITLGEPSFSFFCQNHVYRDRLGKITKSNYGNIYAVYHPSPLNINDPSRRKIFNKQIKLLAKLIKKIN